MGSFSITHKSNANYIDVAANDHGSEKGQLLAKALDRVVSTSPRLLEIGPGGGAAVRYLASQIAEDPRREDIHLTLVEIPGVDSRALNDAIREVESAGAACTMVHGYAQDLDTLIPDAVDAVGASATLHEVYSYGNAYYDLLRLLRSLTRTLRDYGFFAYRDLLAVPAPTLHARVQHSYTKTSWLRFIRMFTPYYLSMGVHPYHHFADAVVASQNSKIVSLDKLDLAATATVDAPIGALREIQRHYVTFRDQVWRSGALGVVPIREGALANDWINRRTGHKRVHYRRSEPAPALDGFANHLRAISERYADHLVIDGDSFDMLTDSALTTFLAASEDTSDAQCAAVWRDWLEREGRETYTYFTLSELLTAVAVTSRDATDGAAILMPTEVGDVFTAPRGYYDRYLRANLPNPLPDGKQMVLFQLIPRTDRAALTAAFNIVRSHTEPGDAARVLEAIWSD